MPSSKKALTGRDTLSINGPLLARVNDWALGINDFNGYLDSLKPLAKAQKLNIDDSKFKGRLLNDLITTQILAQVAKERGGGKPLSAVDVRDRLGVVIAYAYAWARRRKNRPPF